MRRAEFVHEGEIAGREVDCAGDRRIHQLIGIVDVIESHDVAEFVQERVMRMRLAFDTSDGVPYTRGLDR